MDLVGYAKLWAHPGSLAQTSFLETCVFVSLLSMLYGTSRGIVSEIIATAAVKPAAPTQEETKLTGMGSCAIILVNSTRVPGT
jgi:hypothetical protein